MLTMDELRMAKMRSKSQLNGMAMDGVHDTSQVKAQKNRFPLILS